MKLKCPFDQEMLLSEEIDNNPLTKPIDYEVKTFVSTLTHEQHTHFNRIDDMSEARVFSVATNIIRKYVCPHCKKFDKGCP